MHLLVQQAGGKTLEAPAVEITYGMERILMALQVWKEGYVPQGCESRWLLIYSTGFHFSHRRTSAYHPPHICRELPTSVTSVIMLRSLMGSFSYRCGVLSVEGGDFQLNDVPLTMSHRMQNEVEMSKYNLDEADIEEQRARFDLYDKEVCEEWGVEICVIIVLVIMIS